MDHKLLIDTIILELTLTLLEVISITAVRSLMPRRVSQPMGGVSRFDEPSTDHVAFDASCDERSLRL